jgi:hypothetical protein
MDENLKIIGNIFQPKFWKLEALLCYVFMPTKSPLSPTSYEYIDMAFGK